MNLKTKLAASAILLSSISAAQATTYDVHGMFYESLTNGRMTEFVGSFDWDESTKTVSNFSGTMNESMRGYWDTLTPANAYNSSPVVLGQPYPHYMLELASDGGANYNQTASAGLATATVYRNPGDDVVFASGGNGFQAPVPNTENASFKVVFNYDTATGAITTTGLYNAFSNNTPSADQGPNSPAFSAGNGMYDATLVNQMEYGDCTLGSMMMMNNCMAGESTGSSMMMGIPYALEITAAPVPVPAAAWLFGGALMSLFGANRRKKVLPA